MKNFIIKLFQFLAKANSEDNNSPSMIRALITYSVLMFAPVVCFVMIWTVVSYKELLIPVFTIFTGLFSGLFAFKVWQKTKEENNVN